MEMYERLQNVKTRLEAALKRSRHGQKSIQVIGVSKAHSVNLIRQLAQMGFLSFGENYAQELLAKAPLCAGLGIRWHFIGKLQSNKIKFLLPFVSSIDSVDSLELAKKIERMNEQSDVPKEKVSIMLQVNVGHERQKSGLPPNVIEDLFPEFLAIKSLSLDGLMCIPPYHQEAEKMRPYFQEMKELFDRLQKRFPEATSFKHLSMGMSQDFEVAIEEGATMVRLGEAIFGPRPVKE